MRTFVLLSALPGSGKSTWAKQFAKEHPNTHIVSSDAIREKYFGSPQNFKHENEVWEIFLRECNEYAEKEEDCYVIADSTNILNKFRRFYLENTPKFDKHILVCFHIPYEIAVKQNQMRPKEKIVPDYAMELMRDQFEIPSEEIIDAFDEYIVIGKSFIAETLKNEK